MSEKDLMQVCGGCGLMLPIPSDHSCLTENAGIPGGTKVLMRPNTDAAEALWTKLGKPAWKLGLIADEVAAIEKAAEERGRRRGVEERDELRTRADEQDRSATRWAHMYNNLFHSLEPWLRKRLSFLEHEIARGDAFLAAGPRDRWEAESGSGWNVNATGWRKILPEYRSEREAISAALAPRDSTLDLGTCKVHPASHREHEYAGAEGSLLCEDWAPRDSGKEG